MRVIAALLLALTTIAACSGSDDNKPSRPTTTTPSTAASTTIEQTSATTAVTELAPCTTAGLAIDAESPSGAAGHGGIVIRFRNRTSTLCRLSGYPGVAALDSAGHEAAQAERTPRGYIGGLPLGNDTVPVIELREGQTASALVETTHAATNETGPCPTYPALLVTPPGETHSVRVAVGDYACTIQVHPVVAGTTGGAPLSS